MSGQWETNKRKSRWGPGERAQWLDSLLLSQRTYVRQWQPLATPVSRDLTPSFGFLHTHALIWHIHSQTQTMHKKTNIGSSWRMTSKIVLYPQHTTHMHVYSSPSTHTKTKHTMAGLASGPDSQKDTQAPSKMHLVVCISDIQADASKCRCLSSRGPLVSVHKILPSNPKCEGC